MSMSGKQMMALEALLLEELIAERDSLRKRVKDLEKQPKQKPVAVFDEKFGRPKMLANAPILTHGQVRRLEHRSNLDREGLAAGIALVDADAGRVAVEFAALADDPALGANATIGPQARLNEVIGGLLIVEERAAEGGHSASLNCLSAPVNSNLTGVNCMKNLQCSIFAPVIDFGTGEIWTSLLRAKSPVQSATACLRWRKTPSAT